MDAFVAYVLILQVAAIVSFTATVLALINASFLFFLQRAQDEANSQFSISLAIIIIFFGDSLSNGTYLSSYRPPTGSVDCSITGFIHLFGYMTTWMFTLYVAYVLYSITVLEKMPTKIARDFTICVGIPTIIVSVQAGVFGFSRYNPAPYEVCIATQNHPQQTIYHEVSFFGLLLVDCILMLGMRCHQWILELRNDPRTQSKLFLASKFVLQFYPIVLILCWIPTLIEDNTGPQTPTWFHIFAGVVRISHGFFLAGMYFKTSDQAKRYFWAALRPLSWLTLLSNDKDSTALLSESYLRERDSTMEMGTSISKGRSTGNNRNTEGSR